MTKRLAPQVSRETMNMTTIRIDIEYTLRHGTLVLPMKLVTPSTAESWSSLNSDLKKSECPDWQIVVMLTTPSSGPEDRFELFHSNKSAKAAVRRTRRMANWRSKHAYTI